MKQYLKLENLPWLTLLASGLGLLLRLWFRSTADEEGFIIRGHISVILLMVLTIALFVALLVSTRSLKQGNKYLFNFPASPVAAIGLGIAGLSSLIISVAEMGSATDGFGTVCSIFGVLAAISFAFVAFGRWKGKKPSVIFQVVISLWLVFRLICLYRTWSSDPRLDDYCFQLMCVICAMLSAYYRGAFGAGFGHRGNYAFFCLTGVYCGIVSIAGPGQNWMYLALAIWLFTDLCNLRPMRRKKRVETQ